MRSLTRSFFQSTLISLLCLFLHIVYVIKSSFAAREQSKEELILEVKAANVICVVYSIVDQSSIEMVLIWFSFYYVCFVSCLFISSSRVHVFVPLLRWRFLCLTKLLVNEMAFVRIAPNWTDALQEFLFPLGRSNREQESRRLHAIISLQFFHFDIGDGYQWMDTRLMLSPTPHLFHFLCLLNPNCASYDTAEIWGNVVLVAINKTTYSREFRNATGYFSWQQIRQAGTVETNGEGNPNCVLWNFKK